MKNLGISIVYFIGDLLIWLAKFIKITSTIFKFMIVGVIMMGIFFITIFSTLQALHLPAPYDNIFKNDLWAWGIMIIGWTTMLYCFKRLITNTNEKHGQLDDNFSEIETDN